MNSVLRPSITRRLAVSLMLACGVVWCAIYGLGRLGVYRPEVGNFDREMLLYAGAARELLETLPNTVEPSAALGGLAAAVRWNGKVHGTPDGFVGFRVFDSSGSILFVQGDWPAQVPAWDGRYGFIDVAAGASTLRLHRSLSSGARHRIEVLSTQQSRQLVFDGVMFSAGALQPLLLAFPLLLLPVWLAVYRGLSPLRRLTRELSRRRADDLSSVRVSAVYRELEPVIDELNASFARIGTMRERERRFLADAAHELRTPLAVIGAQIETLGRAQDDRSRAAALARLDSGWRRATRLTHQLLALARLDADVEQAPANVDLADVCRDTLAMHAQAAHLRGIELVYVGPDSLVRRCPLAAVESMLDNLIGNAVRHGRADGRVEVGLRDEPPLDGITLWVSDDGPGIPDCERESLFDRFRRGEGAQASGAGLGLAIVRSAARQLDARIDMGPGLEGAGISFRVCWLPGSTAPLGADPSA